MQQPYVVNRTDNSALSIPLKEDVLTIRELQSPCRSETLNAFSDCNDEQYTHRSETPT
jgi:hypothetical protein